jgi:hypothetical protein
MECGKNLPAFAEKPLASNFWEKDKFFPRYPSILKIEAQHSPEK